MHYSEKPIKLKAISLILLALFFGFSGHSFAEKKNKREEKPTVVLLPVILHGEQSRDSVASYQDAAAESLQSKYKVIVGSKVEEVLKKVTAKESQKENCDLTRCYGAIAVEFNAEYLAVLNVTKSEGDYSFSIKVMDVIANELVISKTDTCPACKAYQVVEKLKLLVPAEKTVKAEKVEKTPAPVVVSEPTPPPAPRAVEKPFVALSVEFLNNFRANDQESLKKFAELADAENVQAQLMMGVKADDAGNFPEAIRWYQRAGGNGYGAGWMMLGTLYASGRGMLKDELQAGALYKKGLETL
ncbi:MAG: sel1 repeat family protein, partial [Nitrospinae bacterium]|nr:sel1 repeat family protein [Nitrospinota bacterium]